MVPGRTFSIFRSPDWRRVLATLPLACLLIGSAVAAQPEPAERAGLIREIKLGLMDHDTGGLWSGVRREERAIDLNMEMILSPGISFARGIVRPAVGATVNTRGDTSKLYFYARWQMPVGGRFFIAAGVGGALHTGEAAPRHAGAKALGAGMLFHLPLEIGWRIGERASLSLSFDHMSNGYLAAPNEGLDTVGLRWGWRLD